MNRRGHCQLEHFELCSGEDVQIQQVFHPLLFSNDCIRVFGLEIQASLADRRVFFSWHGFEFVLAMLSF